MYDNFDSIVSHLNQVALSLASPPKQLNKVAHTYTDSSRKIQLIFNRDMDSLSMGLAAPSSNLGPYVEYIRNVSSRIYKAICF